MQNEAIHPAVRVGHDRPRAEWLDGDGRPVLKADRFDPRELLPSP